MLLPLRSVEPYRYEEQFSKCMQIFTTYQLSMWVNIDKSIYGLMGENIAYPCITQPDVIRFCLHQI